MNSGTKQASSALCRLQRLDGSATEISEQLHYFKNISLNLTIGAMFSPEKIIDLYRSVGMVSFLLQLIPKYQLGGGTLQAFMWQFHEAGSLNTVPIK